MRARIWTGRGGIEWWRERGWDQTSYRFISFFVHSFWKEFWRCAEV